LGKNVVADAQLLDAEVRLERIANGVAALLADAAVEHLQLNE